MKIVLDGSEIAAIVRSKISEQYHTPNVSIVDKSLRKLQKLEIELQVIPSASRSPNMQDVLGGEAMQQLASRMQVDGDIPTIIPEFSDSGI